MTSRHASSFRDPAGFVFRRDGVLLRQINEAGAADLAVLHDSGLYDELTGRLALIPHEVVDEAPAEPEGCHCVIRPAPIAFVSHPYEWCFGQLREAALLTLDIQLAALARGVTLKDASAYNVMFHEGSAVFIDTLSFTAYEEGEPWAGYGQFCRHFVAPLALMSRRDARCALWLRNHLDGIPLDLASALLPRRTWFSPGLLTHLHLHARTVRRYQDKTVGKRTVSKQSLVGLLQMLRKTVTRLDLPRFDSHWADYYDDNNYDEAGETAWLTALSDLGFIQGYHYDVFRTNAPHLHGSNDLGSRVDVAGIAEYETILYSSGDRTMYTLSNFHQSVEKGDDLALMDGWLQLGRNLLATGDNVAYDVNLLQGFDGLMFAEQWFSTDAVDNEVRQQIGGQVAPTVYPLAGNSVFLDVDMVAYGGCPSINRFDALEPWGTAERIAEWADPGGVPGAYPFLAAGVRNQVMGSDVVLYAADLTFWYTSPGSPPGQWAPAGVLEDILGSFGHTVVIDAVDDLPMVFDARVAPNPFNPRTEIRFDLPRDGRVQLRIHDLRGAVVRTLVDAAMNAGAGHVARWDGTDERGAEVASGVYFYRLETTGERPHVGKMALIR